MRTQQRKLYSGQSEESRKRARGTVAAFALAAALCPALMVGGCGGSGGGGQTTGTTSSLFPQQVAGGRVQATDQITFSGVISGGTSQTARYILEKPLGEANFDDTQTATNANPKRGTINPETGVYIAPDRLPDSEGPQSLSPGESNATHPLLTEIVTTVDQNDYDRLTAQVRDIRRRVVEAMRDRADEIEDTARRDALNTVINGDDAGIIAVLQNSLYADLRSAAITALTVTDLQFVRAQEDPRYSSLLLSDAIAGRDVRDAQAIGRIVYARNVTQPSFDDGQATEVLRRPRPATSLREASVRFAVAPRLVVSTTTTDVSIRDAARLGDYVQVQGDERLYNPATQRQRTLNEWVSVPENLTRAGAPVQFSLVNPAAGAGGSVDPVTGEYKAPLTRRAQTTDTIEIVSTRDTTLRAQITVNVVAASAPSNLVIQ